MTEQDIYAPPRVVTALSECHFYQTMDVPGFGTIVGEWDLRPGISEYLGRVDFRGKGVLEIGTASGYVCFHIEALGGDVVAVDLSERETWDIVPYVSVDPAAVVAQRRAHARRINSSFWLCHRAYGSRARVVHSTAYQIPDAIGLVDVSVFACVLLHLRDPWLALERAARLTRETMIVTDLAPADDRELTFVPDPHTGDTTQTWWQFSPAIIIRYLAVLGFGDAVVTHHKQQNASGLIPMFTVVARRHAPLPARTT
jgi:SAM-dependent methyltransferase